MNSGIVFDIQRFSLHDGPGIRTTVFLKGCSLRCLWCHNPESQDMHPELSFISEKCIGCGWCLHQCPAGAHCIDGNRHILDRIQCMRCGKCAEKCYSGALTIIGKEMTECEVIAEVLKDKPFYENSGGGLTISGGEPMLQFEFTCSLLTEAKRHALHISLETCGFASTKDYLKLQPLVNLFLYDLKETNPERHLKYTGVPLTPILDNLTVLDRAGAAIVLRCPIIPGLNDREEHFRMIASIARELDCLQEINLLPYHPLGDAKLARLGKSSRFNCKNFTDDKTVAVWCDAVRKGIAIVVRRS